MESMIGQIEEQQTLMAEMLLEMQNRDTQLFFDSLDSFIYITSFLYLLFQFSNSVFCFSNKLFTGLCPDTSENRRNTGRKAGTL